MRMPALLAALLAAAPAAAADAPAATKPKVKLAVLVVFDQMRGDYVAKWQPLFGDGGFKRLQETGAWFPDCHYPYGSTSTGPGHASILAGCSADKHGIINNNWYDRATAADVYCAGSPRYELVPGTDPAASPDNLDPRGKKVKAGVVGTPERFLGPTLADVLKAHTNGAGKVFGLSLKDRAAILPAGKKPDGAYWFEGKFSTSTYYRDSLPPWAAAFNKAGLADSYFGKDWVKFRPDLDYTRYAGRDDAPGEGSGKGQGTTFPHPTTGGKAKIGKDYYEAVVNSPYGNDLLLAFAKACVTAEKLGQDDVPDLLTISFSSNDLVGHAWGPDSHEVLDITLRSDKIVADLLAFLDDQVGLNNYTVVVTADHGVCPVPEVAAAGGNTAAKRLSPVALTTASERHLRDTFGPPPAPAPAPAPDATAPAPDAKAAPAKDRNLWVEAFSPPHIYLNHAKLTAAGKTPADAADSLAAFLKTQPGIARAYTHGHLSAALPPGESKDEYLAPTRHSFHPARGGDVVIVTEPYVLLDGYGGVGTSHGTPHEYDTHAVFLAAGPGIGGVKKTEAITPLVAAAILADALGINPPANAAYPVPATLGKP